MTQLFQEFQQFRKILCVCPCCGNLIRVSDLKLITKGETATTWLDKYEKKELVISNKEERLENVAAKTREAMIEKGRKSAERVFNNSISPSLKSIKLDPYDVKPILNPVDFVVFKGMNKNEHVSEVMFLCMKYNIPTLNILRNQIEDVIAKKEYDIQVARIDEVGKILLEEKK